MNRPWDLLTVEERTRRVREHLGVTHIGCTECAYDLFGLEGNECPECGAPVPLERFAFLAAEPSDEYQARRLADYLKKYKTACPNCGKPLDSVNGCACPGCGARLDVWRLTPCGLRGGKRARLKWALIITAMYIVLAAAAGLIMLLGARTVP